MARYNWSSEVVLVDTWVRSSFMCSVLQGKALQRQHVGLVSPHSLADIESV